MKNKPLLLKILAVCLLITLALTCVVGCKDKESYQVEIDKTQITLSAGTFVQLTATANKEGAVIEWASSDENVATVTSDGKVYGVNEGSADITAKYSTASATCKVVVEPSEIPVFISAKINGIIDTEYDLFSGDVATLELKLFDGANEIVSTFSVESSNTNVVDYEDGAIVAKGVGNAIVTFATTYKGETYQSSITVNVSKTLYIAMNKNEVDLSAATEGGDYPNVYDLAPSVYANSNELITDAEITYSVDTPDIVSVEDGVITALKKGKTKITLTYNYGEGNSASTFVEITVHLTEKTFKETILLSKFDFTESYKIGAEYVEGEVVYCQTTYSDGSVKSLDKAEFPLDEYKTGKYKVIVETTTANYTGEMILADMVINSKEELKNWPYYIRPSNWANNVALEYDGYVVLGKDIDYGGDAYYNELTSALVTNVTEGFVEISKTSNSVTYYSSGYTPSGELQTTSGYKPKFVGTFDGLGHCISNIKFAKSGVGLMGTYCSGTVKNLAMSSVTLAYYRTGAICFDFTGVAENLFLEGVISHGAAGSGLLATQCSSAPALLNISAVVSEGNQLSSSAILIGAVKAFDTASTKVCNLFGIGNLKMLASGGSELSNSVYNSISCETLQAFKTANKKVDAFAKNEYWDVTVSGFPIMKSAIGKLSKINLQATDGEGSVVTQVAKGGSVNIDIANYKTGAYVNNQAGFSTVTVSDINGVTYENGVLTVASNVSVGTQITLTVLNKLDGSVNTLNLTVK